ncbi:MAG: cupin domain-containing protein [Bacteroidales bacterium]
MKKIMNLFDDSNWTEAKNYPEGTMQKTLRDENGVRTILLKLPKGFVMESHSHISTEQHLVLEGSYITDGVKYPAGSYQIIRAHEDHGPFQSLEGAMILVIWDPIGN